MAEDNQAQAPQAPAKSPLQAALEYAARGWAVIPLHGVHGGVCSCSKGTACDRAGKHPRTKTGVKEASTDAEAIRGWWAQWPDANVGIATGPRSGLVVLDIDVGGDQTLAAIAGANTLPSTLEATTGRGRHVYFAAPATPIANSAGKLGPGLDIRGTEGHVVAPPSAHASGADYAWIPGHTPAEAAAAELPGWLLALLNQASPSMATTGTTGKVLAGQRNDRLYRRGCSLVSKDWAAAAIVAALVAENEARCSPPLGQAEVFQIAQSVERHRKSAVAAATAANSDLPLDDPDQPEGVVVRIPHSDRQNQEVDDVYSVVCRLLRTDALGIFGGTLRWNEMLLAPTVGGKELGPADRSRVHERLEVFHNLDGFSRGLVDMALDQIAQERSFHPVREYLSRLTWDGTPRIANIRTQVLCSKDDPVTDIVIRKWMISAVARAMKPGCKVDTVLILVGPQGAGKSSFFETLASEEWFSDSTIDIHSKDSYMTLARAWLVEFPELESMQRARDVDSVKAFLSSRVDVYRPPYGRTVTKVPRSCVIVGTTNQDAFLTDPTGNRRYWPVTTGQKLRLDLLEPIQLWAEAAAAFRAGESWWLSEAEEQQLNLQRTLFEVSDAWDASIEEFLEKVEGQVPFTTGKVLQDVLGKQAGHWTKSDEMRVASILKRRGVAQRRQGEKRTRVWVRTPRPAQTPAPSPEAAQPAEAPAPVRDST